MRFSLIIELGDISILNQFFSDPWQEHSAENLIIAKDDVANFHEKTRITPERMQWNR